jgi:hypothetical protein
LFFIQAKIRVKKRKNLLSTRGLLLFDIRCGHGAIAPSDLPLNPDLITRIVHQVYKIAGISNDSLQTAVQITIKMDQS